MNKIFLWILILFSVFLAIALLYIGYLSLDSSENEGSWQARTVNQSTVAEVLQETAYVQEIPESGIIQLYLGDLTYIVRKGSVQPGTALNPDIVIRLPESYLEIMSASGPCAAFATARQRGELGIETEASASSLSWKYRNLLKYRSCFGIE